MDIKFGFADTPRELIVSSTSEQAELTQKINSALAENSTVELEDDKGRKYLVRTDRVVYVEVGPAKKQSVGFAGA
ncbi:DUF3107 family protein [Corynebacterium macginleyi]|uniref:DUF3107 domain-containing protein n=1 Tax=Corynebacterium macginleyi TaxID=38290 RepID=A0A3M0GL01_9CORY|nr:DUF3107 domain-containing protein [Corynebacterium macginleyi]MBK4138085.1 DUF3107 family protein [Corynebacterium macginleyi]MBK4140636.1 DUF3107 family protein [Corynebacterium macginleyi]MBK4142461.1 DUF3107 family protein [Corynebacterium macginleyi]MBK4144889.1 DUF3107 family protein [Corynebacterium macginleyi]MBK4145569.1 DUF3107 family protein [Corynebacterium macginleyi]